jgi:hypothetical protein
MHIISVGDPDVPWTSLAPQADAKHVLWKSAKDQQDVGVTTETIRIIDLDDYPAIQRVQTLESSVYGTRVSTSVVA